MIEKNVILEILKRVQVLLSKEEIYYAKEYIKLEIENFEGITPRKCKNTIYKFYYCDKCSNINCPDNKCINKWRKGDENKKRQDIFKIFKDNQNQ